MFDTRSASGGARQPTSPAAAGVRELADRVRALPTAMGDVDCVDLLDELERLKGAAAATQARVTDTLDRVRQAQSKARDALEVVGRSVNPDAGVGLEIGLARRESPHRGRAHLRLARALVGDLPLTLAALDRGDISERRAEIVATETASLTGEQRRAVDHELAVDLPHLGDAKLLHATRRIVLRFDEAGFLERRARAHRARRVTGCILADGTAQLTAVLSSECYAAIIHSLDEAAALARVSGDERTRGQVLADIFTERLTGSAFASAPPVALKLVMSAETLLGDDCEPGYLAGCGHVPASVARSLVARGLDSAQSSVQRLFHFPATGALVAMESESRTYRGQLARLLEVRDQLCRTPYCNAPVRHLDHIQPVAAGGATTQHNGQGLCEACNYAKESPGFRQRPVSGDLDLHEVEITTPTRHRHRSRAPTLATRRPDYYYSPAEDRLANLVLIA